MLGVRVQIVRCIDPEYPGWVECQLTDAHVRRWSFIEKIPVVTGADLDPSGPFPQLGIIACELLWRGLDASGARSPRGIDTERPWGRGIGRGSHPNSR